MPPVELCRGTSPIHAAKSRPDRKIAGSGTVAERREAMIGPMPGIVARRRATASVLAPATISVSSLVIRRSSVASSAVRVRSALRALAGMRPSLISDHGSQFFGLLDATRRNNPEFGQVAPQRIDQHGTLPNQQIADTVRSERCLLFWGLDRHKAHRGPAHGFADGFGIGRIMLVALHIRFDIAGRHQTHVVPATSDLTRPEVGGAAGLNADNAGRQSGKEVCYLAPAQPPVQNNFPRSVNSVELENMLREIDPDGANLVHGWLLFW